MLYIIILKIREQRLTVEIKRPCNGFAYKDENEEFVNIYNNEILFKNSTKDYAFNIYMNDDTTSILTPGSFIVVLKCNVENIEVEGKYIWDQIFKILPLRVS